MSAPTFQPEAGLWDPKSAEALAARHREVLAGLRQRLNHIFPAGAGPSAGLLYDRLKATKRKRVALVSMDLLQAAADLAAAADMIDGVAGRYCPPAERGWEGWTDWCARRALLYLESAAAYLRVDPLPADYHERRRLTLADRWAHRHQEVAA